MSTDKTQTIISFLMNTTYWHDQIVPQFLGVWDFSGNGFWQPSIKYEPSDLWNLTLGSTLVFGTSNADGYFGPVRSNNEIYTRLRIKF